MGSRWSSRRECREGEGKREAKETGVETPKEERPGDLGYSSSPPGGESREQEVWHSGEDRKKNRFR